MWQSGRNKIQSLPKAVILHMDFKTFVSVPSAQLIAVYAICGQYVLSRTNRNYT